MTAHFLRFFIPYLVLVLAGAYYTYSGEASRERERLLTGAQENVVMAASSLDLELVSVQFLTEEPGMPSELTKEVESMRQMKAEVETQNKEAQSKLDESRKILDQILKHQNK